MTLVCAPPGFGKTTLLAGWFADLAPGRGCWITAGASDDTAIETVLDEATDAGRDVVVIDDAHHLEGEALTKVAQLLADPPPDLDIVLAARADPPIALSRLRLGSRIREIRSAALAFTQDEAGELLRRDELHVRPADVARLHALTEGWVAGLRLIACALERGATPAALAEDETAAQAAVSDYLLAEVLERETPELRRFLLRTSVADRLTPELAMLLADDPRGGSLLEDVHRRGVFVVALDHGWYRYHPLFAALLRARLRVEDPSLVQELHRRAAGWFAAQDMRTSAEAHALAGAHWTLLGDLLRRRWRDLTLAGVFDAKLVDGVPSAALHADAVLGLLASTDPAVAPPPPAVGGALADEAAVIARLRACASGVTDDLPVDRGRDVALRRVVNVLDAELALGRGDLEAVLRIAGPLADAGGWIQEDAKALVALALAIEGSVGFVAGLVAEATTSEPVRSGKGRVASAAAALATSVCDAQQGHRSDRDALKAIADSHGSWAMRLCARTLLSCRNATTSVVGFDSALGHHPLVGRLFVAVGALDVSDTTGRRVNVGGEVERHLLRARHALVSDAPHRARAEAALALGAPKGHPRSVTEAAVIRAAAAAACAEQPGADEAALEAIAVAGRTLVEAPFVAHAAAVTPAIERIARRGGPHQPAAIELLELLARDRAPMWAEPLTERETTVLHLLPSLMSNEEIAESMRLSVNTVKTHLKALYRKLAVERRRDAVVRARELDLL